MNTDPELKNVISDEDAAALLTKPKRAARAKKPEPFWLAKVHHTEGGKTTTRLMLGIAPTTPIGDHKTPEVTYYRAPVRFPRRAGERRGLPMIARNDDGVLDIMREASPRGPYTTNRVQRRGYKLAIKGMIRRMHKAQHRSLSGRAVYPHAGATA